MAKGYVYVMEDGTASKLGVSKHKPEEQRVRQLQTGNPRVINVYAYRYVEDYEEVETEAHRRLESRRTRGSGEWFAVKPTEALAVLDAVIAERRRPLYRQLRSLWEGLQALGMLVGFLMFAAGFGWLWWNYDGGYVLGDLVLWLLSLDPAVYWSRFGDEVVIGIVGTLVWLVWRDSKRPLKGSRRRSKSRR